MKRLFLNTLASSIDTIILIVLSLIATPVFINHFGVSGYGVFVFLSIFSVYGALSFFDLGMEGALMTHVASFEAEGEHVKVRSALVIALLYYGFIGVAIAIGLFGISDWLAGRFNSSDVVHTEVISAVHMVAFNALLQFLSTPFVAVLQGLHHFAITKILSSLFNITQYLVLMAVAIWTSRIDFAFLGIAILTALRLICYAIAYLKISQYGMRVGFDRSLFRILWGTSSVLFLNRLIGLVYNQTGKLLLWWKLPIAEMTVYDVVNRPAALVRVLVGMVYAAIIPEVARLKQLNEIALVKTLYTRLVRYAYLLILPPVIAISVHASMLLEVWVGPEFSQYGSMVRVLMLAMLILPVGSVASTIVVGLNVVKRTVWISVIGTIVNVAVGAACIQVMGVMGLLVGVLVAEVLMAVPYFVFMNRILNIQAMEIIGPFAPITLLAVGIILLQELLTFQNLSTVGWVAGVGCLIFAHYILEASFFLSPSEKRFLLERLHVIKTSPEAA